MTILKENKGYNISCGINKDGNLFLSIDSCGYNLPDTPQNRKKILADYENEIKYKEHVRSLFY